MISTTRRKQAREFTVGKEPRNTIDLPGRIARKQPNRPPGPYRLHDILAIKGGLSRKYQINLFFLSLYPRETKTIYIPGAHPVSIPPGLSAIDGPAEQIQTAGN